MREDINHIKHTVRACAFVLAFGVVSHALAAAGCEEWRTPEYVKTATVADVRRCLAAGADQGTRNAFLYTAARYNEDPAVVNALVAAGADPNAGAGFSETPLHTASIAGNPVMINALVAAGADPNARNRIGETPLHMASILNKAAAIKALLAAGADPHARNNYSETPLVQTQDRAITELLSQAMAARPAGSTVVTVGEGTQAMAPEPAGNPGGTAGGGTRSSPASVARDKPGQNMCADCEVLREKLRILRGKYRTFGEGLRLLQGARREFETNTGIANGIAATYTILQVLKLSFGLATMPCSISVQWLKALLGGAAGLGSYVEDGKPGEATLAAVVGYVGGGGVGVVSDAISMGEFMKRYSSDSKGLDALSRDLNKTILEFQSTRDKLTRERRVLEADLSRGGCAESLDDILRR